MLLSVKIKVFWLPSSKNATGLQELLPYLSQNDFVNKTPQLLFAHIVRAGAKALA